MLAALALATQTVTVNLHDVANQSKTLIGTCVNVWNLQINADGGLYEQRLKTSANMIEPENELKPAWIWQGNGSYNTNAADFILGVPGQTGWAQQNNMKVRGHTLVYASDSGYTIPTWILTTENAITPQTAEQMLREYIHAIAGRYAGKIHSWDVVNEAVDDTPNGRPYNLRDSFWYRKLGVNFLKLAFQFAKEADPNAKLYYNDYGIESGGIKATHVLNLCKYLRSQGAQIDGIGLQFHVGLWANVQPESPFYKMASAITRAKFKFMVTEMDVALNVVSYPSNHVNFGKIPSNPGDLILQANIYRGVAQMAKQFKNCEGLQMWGFTDAHSWIPQFFPGMGAALPWDANYNPKPAAFAIRDVYWRDGG
jgi:endo-1,4-beta-xylanase